MQLKRKVHINADIEEIELEGVSLQTPEAAGQGEFEPNYNPMPNNMLCSGS